VKAVSPISFTKTFYQNIFTLDRGITEWGRKEREKYMCFDAYLKSNLFLEWRF
jgi:hypothetical protein